MIFGYGLLLTALVLSAVAEFYSIMGLVAIFSAAVIPVIIMGASLGLGKIVATVWLHNNWKRAPILFKLYLVPAVAFLMLLTSMGIFGFLSKAHSDQGLVSGDSMAKVAIYDEKIKTSQDNIDVNRKALKQLDEAVDQVMGRSTSETGADKAVAIRKSQAKERTRLLAEITAEQKTITGFREERAPLAAEFRKIEAEVGPIKYIAALVYGDNPDANVLEKAVRLVIILIVCVFDPLALTLILAANKQFEWARRGEGDWIHDKKPELESRAEPEPEIKRELSLFEAHPYLLKPFAHFNNTKPMVANQSEPESHDDTEETDPSIKAAIKKWKETNPTDTIKNQRTKLVRGEIAELPWMHLVADNDPKTGHSTATGFGIDFPQHPNRGDTYVRVDRSPHVVFKYNGNDWIVVDKNITDSYTYDTAYIDHLIDKVSRGEYDPDLLSDIEREQVSNRLNNTNT